MPDDIIDAVLAREEVVRYLQDLEPGRRDAERARIVAHLEEMRTTQRYAIYRTLKHPLAIVYRKLRRFTEHAERVLPAAAAGRVIYASNHRSHLDYLVQPLVLDDAGLRPPVIAAGINMFGGPLGFLHRHVTGAVPIRRELREPAYLVALLAYVSELVQRHDLLFYIEGGRSYSGAMRPPKTGLLHAALRARRDDLFVVPTAIAYDVVLEDRVLAHLGVKKGQRAFSAEAAGLVRHAMGYRSRVFVTFGEPIPLAGLGADSRRDLQTLARETHRAIGRLQKVLPTALVAAAMRPSIPVRELEARVGALIDRLGAAGANLHVTSPRQAVGQGARALLARGVLQLDRRRLRVRDRHVLRYYARSIAHQVPAPPA